MLQEFAFRKTMANTLQAHRTGLLNGYLAPISTGPLEGINNKIGALQRRAYAKGRRQSLLTLKVVEFIRRPLPRVLPRGFVKIRHYGFVANRFRQAKIEHCRRLLGVTDVPPAAAPSVAVPTGEPPSARARESACRRCPQYAQGHLWIVERLLPQIDHPLTSRSVPINPNPSCPPPTSH